MNSVVEACRELQVSVRSIYNWIYKYSSYLSNNKILVVENKSEASKTSALERRLQEVESALGRKQLELDLLNKRVSIAGKELGVDIKKFLKEALEWFRQTQGITHHHNMKALYELSDVSKQSLYKYRKRVEAFFAEGQLVCYAMKCTHKVQKDLSRNPSLLSFSVSHMILALDELLPSSVHLPSSYRQCKCILSNGKIQKTEVNTQEKGKPIAVKDNFLYKT